MGVSGMSGTNGIRTIKGSNSKVYNIDIEKLGIKNICLISEMHYSPRVEVRSLDDKRYSYTLSRDMIEDIGLDESIDFTINEHALKYCSTVIRKEKLQKLNEI